MGERHIDPASWVPHLPSIPIGGKRRYPHDCGEGRPLVVFRGELESSAYCHRCGEVAYHQEQLSIADRLRLQAETRAAENSARASLSFQRPTRGTRASGPPTYATGSTRWVWGLRTCRLWASTTIAIWTGWYCQSLMSRGRWCTGLLGMPQEPRSG